MPESRLTDLMSVLDDILRVKRDEVTVLHRPQTRDLLRRTALDAPPTRDFAGALRREDGTIAVIAEIKRRSPSKGDLAPDLDPGVTAKDYERGGASAVSVLTDREFFGGAIEDLQTVRADVSLPVLRKDFTIDEVQVYETRAIGADAILLILSALTDDAHVRDLQDLAWSLGLAVLVEAHDEAELERGLAVGAKILGVNARNLSTFDEHLDSVADVGARIPTETIAVAESAIRRPEDAAQMAAAGFDAVLVGEALVRADDAVGLVGALGAATVATRKGSG
jgi:indole-3-glycerol phosphate synthase